MKRGPVENLVSLLKAKRSGKGWEAKCPAHEDHKPSLGINEGADGRALIKCHAGCSTDAVLRAIGLTTKDLFASAQSRNGSQLVATTTTPTKPGGCFTKFVDSNQRIFVSGGEIGEVDGLGI